MEGVIAATVSDALLPPPPAGAEGQQQHQAEDHHVMVDVAIAPRQPSPSSPKRHDGFTSAAPLKKSRCVGASSPSPTPAA